MQLRGHFCNLQQMTKVIAVLEAGKGGGGGGVGGGVGGGAHPPILPRQFSPKSPTLGSCSSSPSVRLMSPCCPHAGNDMAGMTWLHT